MGSGHLLDIFSKEEKEDIAASLLLEVRMACVDTTENCFDFFLKKLRRNLKIVGCMYLFLDDFSAHAKGERRGLDRVGQ